MRLSFVLWAMLAMLVLGCETVPAPKTTVHNPLLGSWKMIADQELDSSGHMIAQDTNVSGLIMYAPDGKMSVHLLWRSVRSKIMTDTIMKQDGISAGIGLGKNTWTTEQAKTIIDSYDAYFGDYTVDLQKQVVTHTIIGNLRPEKAGTEYKRHFEIKGDTLLLRGTDPTMKWQVAWVKNK